MFNFRQDMYADVRIEDRFTTVVSYMNGTLKELKERCEKRAFIRVFDGKMWFYSSTTDISDIQNKLDELNVKYDSVIFNSNEYVTVNMRSFHTSTLRIRIIK